MTQYYDMIQDVEIKSNTETSANGSGFTWYYNGWAKGLLDIFQRFDDDLLED